MDKSIDEEKIQYNINDFVEKYSDIILKNPKFYKIDEGYKYKTVKTFRKYFDLNASDLANNIEKALKDGNNLVQSGYYYPKKMIINYAKSSPEFISKLFINLFDEDINVAGRIDSFIKAVNDKFATKKKKSFVDYRFLSFFLAAKKPEKYFYTKSSDYRKFAKLIGYNLEIAGSQGERFQKLQKLASMTKDVLINNPRFLKLHQQIAENFEYKDPSLSWGTYDFIFNISREKWKDENIRKKINFRNEINKYKKEELKEIEASEKYYETLENKSKDELIELAKKYSPPSKNHKKRTVEQKQRIESQKQKEIVKKINNYECQICGFTIKYTNVEGKKRKYAHADHIIDKAKGGNERLNNLLVLCPNHHAMKTMGTITVDTKKKELKLSNKKIDFNPSHLKRYGW
jgi:5-methylcytosine-specific restriction endonuclease McrA